MHWFYLLLPAQVVAKNYSQWTMWLIRNTLCILMDLYGELSAGGESLYAQLHILV